MEEPVRYTYYGYTYYGRAKARATSTRRRRTYPPLTRTPPVHLPTRYARNLYSQFSHQLSEVTGWMHDMKRFLARDINDLDDVRMPMRLYPPTCPPT